MDALARLDWSLIQVFLAVAEEGSLSAAARRLGTSQPTLGRQVKAVEAALGTPVFRRHAKGLALTEAGAAMVAPARAMREAATRISLAAAGQAERLDGTVRITASVAMSLYHMPAIIARIRRDEPAIRIDLVPTNSSRNLMYREADIAVRMYRPRQLDLVTSHLGDLRLGLFAATGYLDRVGRPTGPEDTMRLDFIGYDENPMILEGFAAAGRKVGRDWFVVRCDDNAVYWELVRAGAGAGFAQEVVADRTPGIEQIPLGFDLPTLPVWLTAHEAMRQTPRVRRVWEILADGLRPLVT
ncbi:LysR family transcriptional regulator [Roseisalinus antarcticus]|uniref:HTH-type transcriptional regulator TdfR n=1 Tax=Roseisalinus antarcticus TaxID=254357 RepID=A0A1Y5TEY1_9RHOB|nr:LysR family transcriptional regulator [Roseisalinus antarcticus]SLN58761.1 HTH-type transcriptional regulator TdfR [Roseisalinus antarcticus]